MPALCTGRLVESSVQVKCCYLPLLEKWGHNILKCKVGPMTLQLKALCFTRLCHTWNVMMPIPEALSPQGASVGTSMPHTLCTHLAALDFSVFLPSTCVLFEYHHQADVLISRRPQKQALHPVPQDDFSSITWRWWTKRKSTAPSNRTIPWTGAVGQPHAWELGVIGPCTIFLFINTIKMKLWNFCL